VTDRLEEALEELRAMVSPSVPILSVYINLFPERLERRSLPPRLHGILAPMVELAESGQLGHGGSKSLRHSIERVQEATASLETLLDPSIALFVCDELGLDQRLSLPRRVWDCAVAGPQAYLRPLQATLDEFRKVAAVVVDSRRAEILVFHMGETLAHQVVEAEELRKSNLAGWYGLDEYRNRGHAEEVRHQLFREVAERLYRLQRDQGVELVLVGGHRDATEALFHFLDRRTQAITETFVVDVHTLTRPLLAKTVSGLEEDYERREEGREVEEVYALAAAGGRAVVGVDPVLREAGRHAISELLVHDGAAVEGVTCPGCGSLFRSGLVCRVCGGETKAVPDLFEDVTRAVIDAGGTVEHVMAETRLAEDLVAARLRFATV
jgi:peptide chain release factor subunit 1